MDFYSDRLLGPPMLDAFLRFSLANWLVVLVLALGLLGRPGA